MVYYSIDNICGFSQNLSKLAIRLKFTMQYIKTKVYLLQSWIILADSGCPV